MGEEMIGINIGFKSRAHAIQEMREAQAEYEKKGLFMTAALCKKIADKWERDGAQM